MTRGALGEPSNMLEVRGYTHKWRRHVMSIVSCVSCITNKKHCICYQLTGDRPDRTLQPPPPNIYYLCSFLGSHIVETDGVWAWHRNSREGQLFGVSNKENYKEYFHFLFVSQMWDSTHGKNVKRLNGLMVHGWKKRGHGKGTLHFSYKQMRMFGARKQPEQDYPAGNRNGIGSLILGNWNSFQEFQFRIWCMTFW